MINFPAVSSLHEVLSMLTFESIETLGAGNVGVKLHGWIRVQLFTVFNFFFI